MAKISHIVHFPVMPKQCATCPFRTNQKGVHPDPQLVQQIQTRCLTESSQICHHPRLNGQSVTHLCRGARDFQISIFYRLGILDQPTDQSWQQTFSQITMNYRFDNFLQDVDRELSDLIGKTSQDFPEYNWEHDFQTKFPVADSAREAILQFGSLSDLAVLDPDTIS